MRPSSQTDDASPPPTPSSRGPVPAKAVWTIALLAVVLLVLVLAFQELRARSTAGSATGITAANYRAVAKADGGPAPGFTMPSLDGSGDISLADLSGNVVVLNFWASWCAPCRTEAPDLQATWERYRDRGVRFLGIVYRDDEAAARAFVEEFAITYPSVFDPSGALAYEYDLIGLPTTVVIGTDGRIAYRFTGRIDAAVLQRAIEDVLASGSR